MQVFDEAHRLNRLAERHVVQKARSLMDDLPNLECPVMLIHGRNDNMVPVENIVATTPRDLPRTVKSPENLLAGKRPNRRVKVNRRMAEK